MGFMGQAIILLCLRDAGETVLLWDPCRKILGLTILKRLILTASLAGIKDFIITGDSASTLDREMSLIKRDSRFRGRNFQVRCVPLCSLLDLFYKNRIQDRFWLIDSDVVIDPVILKDVPKGETGPLLRIGPGVRICERDALPKIAETPRTQNTKEAESLTSSGGLHSQHSPGLRAKGRFCLKVGTREEAKCAERHILSTGRKTEDGWMARYVIRPISLLLTRQMLKFNMTPNTMTIISTLFGLMSVWLIGTGNARHAILAGCVFAFASVLDHCDGENARITFRTSKTGAAIDVIGDSFIYVFFFLSLPFGLYRADHQTGWIFLGCIVFLSMGVYYWSIVRMLKTTPDRMNTLTFARIFSFAREIERGGGEGGIKGKINWLAAKLAPLYRREFFSMGVFLVLLLAGPKTLMAFVSILYPLQAIYVAIHAENRIRGRSFELIPPKQT